MFLDPGRLPRACERTARVAERTAPVPVVAGARFADDVWTAAAQAGALAFPKTDKRRHAPDGYDNPAAFLRWIAREPDG